MSAANSGYGGRRLTEGQNQNRNHLFSLDSDFFVFFYATNRELDSYNLQHLKSLNRLVVNVKAMNIDSTAKQAS